jgi:hypothetical protein
MLIYTKTKIMRNMREGFNKLCKYTSHFPPTKGLPKDKWWELSCSLSAKNSMGSLLEAKNN